MGCPDNKIRLNVCIQGVVENLRKWEDQGDDRPKCTISFRKYADELDTRGDGETHS